MSLWKTLAVVVVLCVVSTWAGSRHTRQLPSNPAVVDAAMRNPRFMRKQLNCLLAQGSCDSIGRTLRSMTPGLLRGQCNGCSAQQFQQAMKVMNFVSRSYPQEYNRIYNMYIYGNRV